MVSFGAHRYLRVPTGVLGRLLVSQGTYGCLWVAYWYLWVSEGIYLYQMVTTGVCDCLWVSVGAYWCLMVPTGVCRCLWVSESAFWCLRVTTGA